MRAEQTATRARLALQHIRPAINVHVHAVMDDDGGHARVNINPVPADTAESALKALSQEFGENVYITMSVQVWAG